MKLNYKIFLLLLAIVEITISCQRQNLPSQQPILPTNFSVDIPESISSPEVTEKYFLEDSMSGRKIYSYMRMFVHIGENSAQTVDKIITTIRKFNLNREMSFSYTGEDGRVKNVVIESNKTYMEQTWEFKMTITDAANENNQDSGIAAQIFWNKSPIEGYAIIKPFNLNVYAYAKLTDAMFRIFYSENKATTNNYDAVMLVEISNLTTDSLKRFAVKNLKMFVGREGNRVDVVGNSDHPYAWILIPRDKPGIDWAFVASANYQDDIGVAKVGLPPNQLNSDDRREILDTYSIYNVLYKELFVYYITNYHREPDSLVLAKYLRDARAPGFFNMHGFLQAGTPPNSSYDDLQERIKNLTPFNPYQVDNLEISFAK